MTGPNGRAHDQAPGPAPGQAPGHAPDQAQASVAPTLRYRGLVRLLSPVLLVHLAVRSWRDGGARYCRERLGFGPGAARAAVTPSSADSSGDPAIMSKGLSTSGQRASGRLWIHAASVGEVMTVLPLVRATLASDDRLSIVVTTNTPTGAAVLARHAPPGVHHRYLPIDFPGATQRFLSRERPAAGWIVETEVWPWLYARCHALNIPLTIINARLSTRTARHATGPLATTYRRALASVTVLARTPEDAAGYRALGAEPTRVRTVGELKLADAASDTAPPSPLLDRPYVLAASTHDNEEHRLADAWLASATDGLLVIAPRHAERGAALARQLPGCARRSQGDSPPDDARLYLADTLGELDAWYAHARGVFVGGSLIERGGHNVLEPARRACPIVVGPHTTNFTEPVAMLKAANAIADVPDAEGVARFLARAMAEDGELVSQGLRAREAALAAGRDMVGAYLEELGTSPDGV